MLKLAFAWDFCYGARASGGGALGGQISRVADPSAAGSSAPGAREREKTSSKTRAAKEGGRMPFARGVGLRTGPPSVAAAGLSLLRRAGPAYSEA